MLKFKSITWKNFLSTGNSATTIDLDRSKTTLIIGKNGHGKSSILDALTFALFGKPFRNVNKGQLINSINGKGCSVEIEFDVNNKTYKVVRGMKPNKFEIWCGGEMLNQDAAAKDYQKVLEQQILKLNYRTFTQVVILGSASFVPFMQLSSSQRREVIEDILDIKIFSNMNQILKEKVSETRGLIQSIDNKIDLARSNVEAQNKLIKKLTAAKDEVVSSIETKILNNKNEVDEQLLEIEKVQAEISTLREKLKNKPKIDSAIDKAKNIKSKISNKLNGCITHSQFFEDNDTCPSCSQSIPEEHKQSILSELKSKIAANETKLSEIETAIVKFSDTLTEMETDLSNISEKAAEVSTKQTRVSILQKLNDQLQSELESAKMEAPDIAEERYRLKVFAKEAMSHLKEKTALQEQRALQDIASVLLKDTGIKTAVIREYLPIMNKLINKYLSAMDAYIQFELDESFNETVKSRYRDDFTYASFSEGEKQKIDLAILFTWRHIAKLKNSVNTNLLIMDEICDASLDSNGIDQLMVLLEHVSSDTNVFVISHRGDQLFDKFHSVIKFEKINDFSSIVP